MKQKTISCNSLKRSRLLTWTLALNLVSQIWVPGFSQNAPAQTGAPILKSPIPGSVNPSIPPDDASANLSAKTPPAPTAKGSTLSYKAPNQSVKTTSVPPPSQTNSSQAGNRQVAQSISPELKPAAIGGGSVQLRKSFKLFANQSTPTNQRLIHNLSFRDTPIRAVIAELAREGNLNILIDKSVGGTLTGDLRDVTLDEAMTSVLSATGMQHRLLDNNTVLIGTPVAMVQLGLNRPVARTFKLNYASPFDVATLLQTSVFNPGTTTVLPQARPTGEDGQSDSRDQAKLDIQNRIVNNTTRLQIQEGVGFNNGATDPGSQQIRAFQEVNSTFDVNQNSGGAIVIPDNKNLQILIVGTQADIDIAEQAIRLLDRRPKEVHIQASFVELTNQGIRELGTNLALQGGGGSGSILGNAYAPLTTPLAGQPANTVGIPITNTSIQSAQIIPTTTSQTILNFLTLGKNSAGHLNVSTFPQALNVTLTLLLQTNKAKLIANPSVVVVDNTEALITIASEVIHKVTSTVSLGVVTTNVELTKAGIFLNVLPKVADDGFITMRLRPQVSLPIGGPQTFGSTASPTIVTLLSVRDIMSQEIRIKDGQTLVLGGLFTEQEQSAISKIPYFSEAPVLGALFRNTIKGRNRTETMLLITPKIVEDEPPSALSGRSSPTM